MNEHTQKLYDAMIENAKWFIAQGDMVKAQELIEAAVVLRKTCEQQ